MGELLRTLYRARAGCNHASVAVHRTSSGDPARTLALLWRERRDGERQRGPRPRLSVDGVVDEAVALADGAGLDAVTMRALARRLSVSPMALYTYVPGKAELLDCMVDTVHARMPRRAWTADASWRDRLRTVAEDNRALYADHPWAARVSTARPPLGPGSIAKYEHELAALDDTGLGDVETDAALGFLQGFVQAAAIASQESMRSRSEAEWWAEAGPLLGRVLDTERYPRAVRVGGAAGASQGAAYDAERAYRFGLERVLDGLEAIIEPVGRTP